jgi:hypothetical protein
VNWAKATAPDISYEVVLPESRLVLAYRSPRAEPDVIALHLHDATGAVVGSLAADEPDDVQPGGITGVFTLNPSPEPQAAKDWKLLRDLFSEVHLSATGFDKVVKDIEKALAGPGPVGKSKHP